MEKNNFFYMYGKKFPWPLSRGGGGVKRPYWPGHYEKNFFFAASHIIYFIWKMYLYNANIFRLAEKGAISMYVYIYTKKKKGTDRPVNNFWYEFF